MKRFTTSSAELKNFISRTLEPTIRKIFKSSGVNVTEYDIEEVVSITLEKISANIHTYKEEKSSNMWFVTIAKNATIDYIKECEKCDKNYNFISLDSYTSEDEHKPISDTYMQIHASDYFSSDYNLRSKSNIEDINNAISSMPLEEARILRMLTNGYKRDEICEALNMTDGACRTKLSRIRKKFSNDPRIKSLCYEFNCVAA